MSGAAVARLREKFLSFFFPPEADHWVSVLRIGLGLQVALYTLATRWDWVQLFGSSGHRLVNRDLAEAVVDLSSPFIPRLGWLIAGSEWLGLREETVLWSVWILLLVGAGFLVAGLFSRAAAVLTWFLHLCAVKSADFLTYGMDNFTTIGLFYLMLSPLPDRASLDYRWRKRTNSAPRFLGFFRRALQLHVCIIYLFAGLTKALGPEWWDGTSIWRALTSPPYNIVAPEVLVNWKLALPFLSSSVVLLELTYPVFVWFEKTRRWWLAAICAMHVAIGLTMGLYLFSLIMIILNVAAFAAPAAHSKAPLLNMAKPKEQPSGFALDAD
ncbi:MAG TPA: HTTM domain-containing protein [Chthoniobacterales bacterium]|nr:HTTM domain-containing protein [Chthoniobacterales bacterium]